MLNGKNHKVLFFIILLIGFILRVFSLETNGLWIDEIWSMRASSSQNSIAQIIEICANDTHPPLFDILLHYILILFNDAEFSGRYLALFIGILGLATTYFYTKVIAKSQNIALLAMAIVSFNYFHIIYSFEGRFYTLIYLLSLISIAELYLFSLSGTLKNLISFTIGTLLLVYTHYYGAILLTVLSIIIGLQFLMREISKKQLLQYIIAAALIFALFLPWLPNMLAKNEGGGWIGVPSLSDFFNYYYLYTGKNPVEFILLFIPLLLSYTLFKGNKKLYLFLYGNIILGFLIPYLASQFNTPLLHKRYTFIYLPSIYLMAALYWSSIKKLKPKAQKVLILTSTVAILANLIFLKKDFKIDQKDQWKEVSIFIADSDLPVYTEHSNYLDYYLSQTTHKKVLPSNLLTNENANSFWLLCTNYDTENLIEKLNLTILETKDYPQKFYLHKIKNE